MKQSVTAILLLLTAFTMPARATVIYGDIAGSGNQALFGYVLGPGPGIDNYIAEGFTMTGSYNLQSVDVILSAFNASAGSNIALSIFSDNAGLPGSDLYDLSTNINIPFGPRASVNLTGSGSFILNSGTTYWLEMYATNPSNQTGSSVTWNGEFITSLPGNAIPIGPGAVEVGQLRFLNGFVATYDLRTAFQLNGVAVPEPSTLALLTLGGVIAFAAKRRRPAAAC